MQLSVNPETSAFSVNSGSNSIQTKAINTVSPHLGNAVAANISDYTKGLFMTVVNDINLLLGGKEKPSVVI